MAERHTVVDNVIFANFGRGATVVQPPAVPTVRSKSTCYAADFFLEIADGRADDGRIQRGRKYARSGNVVGLTFHAGKVVGEVAGSQNEPFEVQLKFPYLGADELAALLRTIAELPHGIKHAAQGTLPDEYIYSFLAAQPQDVVVYCSCPDIAPVCKHAVAVAEVTAEYIRAEPARLFALRGFDFAQIQSNVGRSAAGVAHDNANDAQLFWQGRTLPDVPAPATIPAIDDADIAELHKALRCVSYTTIDELRGVADIEDMYEFLTRE